MDELTKALALFLKGAVDAGFQFPLYMAAVAVNGSVIVYRWKPDAETGDVDPDLIAEHIEDEMMAIPINVMLTDSTGQAARMLIEASDKEPEFFWPDSLPDAD